jgi:hypothetical protein
MCWPVMLVFLARETNISAQSWRSVCGIEQTVSKKNQRFNTKHHQRNKKKKNYYLCG